MPPLLTCSPVSFLRPRLLLVMPCLAWLTAAGGAFAAPVTWETPQPIAGAADVSVEGGFLGSWAPYNGNAHLTPVNGVTFTGNSTVGLVATGFDGGGGNFFNPHTSDDANYNTLLGYATYANGTSASFVLNGNGSRPLTVGRQYLIQFWVSDPRTLPAPRSQTISGSAALAFPADGSGMGHYVIGRFTADADTQEFVITADVSAQVNLLQVRDVTPVASTAAYFSGASANVWDTGTTAAWSSATGGPYNKTWTAAGQGTAVFQGTATTVSLDETVEAGGVTFTTPGYTLTGAGTVALGGAAVIDSGAGAATIEAVIGGLGGLNKKGAGTLTLTGANTYSGPTILTAGTLDLYRDSDTNYAGSTTITGGGILLKTGSGRAGWGEAQATFAMAAGSLIDVQSGGFTGGSSGNEVWTTNQSNLNVAGGAVFHGVEANVRVNALTGEGTIQSGYPGAGYSVFTFGAGDGSGTFSGVLANEAAPGNFTKTGTGTQTLEGLNTYTGNTTVEGGVLSFATATLPDAATVSIASGAVLNLSHAENDTIGKLVLDTVEVTAGRWGATGSVAAGKADYETALITGTGVLLVTVGELPTTQAFFSGAAGTVWDTSTTADWSAVSGGPYNKTWSSLVAGVAVFQGTAGTVSMESSIPVGGILFSTTDYVLTGSGQLSLNGAGIVDTGAGTATIETNLGGSGLDKQGAGTLVLSGLLAYNGPTALTGGTLELFRDTNADYTGVTTITGSGTLRKTGAGRVGWGTAQATFAMQPGSLIDVVSGDLTGGSNGNEVWTDNQSDLNVAAGAVFHGVEANVRVNALSGEGTILSGYPGAGYSVFTFGAGDGSGTFSGVLADEAAPGNFTKTGAGAQTLEGVNTYTGNTTVAGGELSLTTASLPDGGTVTIAPGAVLDLTHGEEDAVAKLVLDTTEAAAGRWGRTGSVGAGMAEFETDAISGTGVLLVGGVASPAYDGWAAANIGTIDPSADATREGDPDGDGATNLAEFALNGNPLLGTGNHQITVAIHDVGGAPVLTMTIPVRDDARFTTPAGAELVSDPVDGIVYRIQSTHFTLTEWPLNVTEIIEQDAVRIQEDVPLPEPGWTLRTFRAPDSVPFNPKAFLRAVIESP